jgi:hypothetical protein
MQSTIRFLTSTAIAVAAGWTTLPAAAADTFGLRALNGQANWSTDPDAAALQYRDFFNNGDAQTGASYSGGLVAPTPNLYFVTGEAAGAETTPGDFSIEGQALGLFTFSRANAGAPSILTVDGNPISNQSHFLRMNGPTNASGGGDTLFRQGRPNFAGSSAWNFVTPDAGARYGMRFTDANIGDVGFDDLISLDVISGAGGPSAQLRRIAGNEDTGARTITEVETKSFASGVFAGTGMSLADVNLISMHMYWDAGTNEISADIEMLRVGAGGASIDLVGQLVFSNRYDIFNGVDKLDPTNENAREFTRLQVGAQWSDAVTAPVPEPSTYALMAGGLLAVGWAARRRRRA